MWGGGAPARDGWMERRTGGVGQTDTTNIIMVEITNLKLQHKPKISSFKNLPI
jgi:hypothetical protein